MSELVLQTMVDKFEHIEKVLLERDNNSIPNETGQAILNEIKSLRNELRNISGSVKISNEKVNEILIQLDTITSKFNERISNNVTHHHQLHKGIWVAAALFIVSALLLMGWINSYSSRRRYEANDMKYRYLKIISGQYLTKTLYNIDSIYNANPEALIKNTIQEEERVAEQSKLLYLAGEKEKEANKLKAKAKKRK